jgi:hypothetical protein
MNTRGITEDEIVKRNILAIGMLLAVAVGVAEAQETNHYPNGTSGILGGTLPPPGKYVLNYNLFLSSDRLNDNAGNRATNNFSLFTYANATRFLFVTNKQILGADFSWNFVVPFVYNNIEIGDFGIRDASLTVGDLNVEPFVIEWRRPRFDFGLLYGFFAPTGKRSAERTSFPGKNYWTHYPGIAATYYFDDDKSLSASFLSRYEFHSKRKDRDVMAGQYFSFEWGVGKTVDTSLTCGNVLTLGVSGYCLWQTTTESGADAANPDFLDRAYAVGPEIQMFFPKHNFGFHFRYWREFGVRNDTEGDIATLTIVKPY